MIDFKATDLELVGKLTVTREGRTYPASQLSHFAQLVHFAYVRKKMDKKKPAGKKEGNLRAYCLAELGRTRRGKGLSIVDLNRLGLTRHKCNKNKRICNIRSEKLFAYFY